MKRFSLPKVLGFIVLAHAAIALVGFVVMTLWNMVLVPVLAVKAVTYWQAIGIFVLSKILFGGFKKGCRNCCGNSMKEKWHGMSPEEKDKFKQEWRNRCYSWKRGRSEDADASTTN